MGESYSTYGHEKVTKYFGLKISHEETTNGIREVLLSNLGQETNYPQLNSGIVLLYRPQRLRSTSFSIHHSQPFYQSIISIFCS
jgi:hypothetical protein